MNATDMISDRGSGAARSAARNIVSRIPVAGQMGRVREEMVDAVGGELDGGSSGSGDWNKQANWNKQAKW